MAKAKSSGKENNKVSFGKRKKGSAKKSKGPKDKATKPYKGQGK